MRQSAVNGEAEPKNVHLCELLVKAKKKKNACYCFSMLLNKEYSMSPESYGRPVDMPTPHPTPLLLPDSGSATQSGTAVCIQHAKVSCPHLTAPLHPRQSFRVATNPNTRHITQPRISSKRCPAAELNIAVHTQPQTQQRHVFADVLSGPHLSTPSHPPGQLCTLRMCGKTRN